MQETGDYTTFTAQPEPDVSALATSEVVRTDSLFAVDLESFVSCRNRRLVLIPHAELWGQHHKAIPEKHGFATHTSGLRLQLALAKISKTTVLQHQEYLAYLPVEFKNPRKVSNAYPTCLVIRLEARSGRQNEFYRVLGTENDRNLWVANPPGKGGLIKLVIHDVYIPYRPRFPKNHSLVLDWLFRTILVIDLLDVLGRFMF